MVLNRDLRFQRIDWILVLALLLFVVLNMCASIGSKVGGQIVRTASSLYLCLLVWLSFPAIAIAIAGPVLSDPDGREMGNGDPGRRSGNKVWAQVLAVCVSMALTWCVPLLLCRYSALPRLTLLFLSCESLRFSIKTLLYALRLWTGSVDSCGSFVSYMFCLSFEKC